MKSQQALRHTSLPLPSLPTVDEIQKRLGVIFPPEFPNRGILVGVMAARVIFVFLYGGAIDGYSHYLRPSHVYLFTEEQAGKTTEEERRTWISNASKQRFRPEGKRWYADTSREPIRDDLMRNQLLRLGLMQKVPGYAPTSSEPINYLTADFAALFAPDLVSDSLEATVKAWSTRHLDSATQQRMTLKAHGISAKQGDLLVDVPDGTRIRITAGPSSVIAKDLIEQFAHRHLEAPALLWLSGSDKKSFPQFAEIAASVGLEFDLNAELPDAIFADMKQPVRFIFCEIVATDGPVTEARKQALLAIVNKSRIPQDSVEFLTAFEDRESGPFRKAFSQLAVNSLIWFRTEPDLLVILSTVGNNSQILL
jgi:hypothetical protein